MHFCQISELYYLKKHTVHPTVNWLMKMLYSEVVDRHALFKHRVLRGNQALFMTKGLSRQIMIRSRLRNKFNKHKTTQNWNAYKAQRNKCILIRTHNILHHFSSLCDNGGTSIKVLGLGQAFFSEKRSHGNENYTLLENGKLIEDHREISEIFNNHYVNVIKNITSKKQERSHSDCLSNRNETERKGIFNSILEKYSGQPSILNITQHFSSTERNLSQFSKAELSDILEIIRNIKLGTSVGADNIPPKLVAMSAEVIAEPLTDLINRTTSFFLVLGRWPQ